MHTSSHFTFPGKHFLLVFIASLLALSSLVAPVYAASMVNSVRNIQLSPDNGPPNTIVTVNGVGFGIQESVVITFDSQQIGSGMTNGQGAFAIKFTVPNDVQPGFYLVVATGQNSGRTARATFLVHYKWRVVPNPGRGSLQGVAVVSANDIWAVGNINKKKSFTEHWNGTSWSIAPSPSSGGTLNGVAEVSANDIWAVGSGSSGTLVEQWNGSAWSVVSSPSPDSSSTLYSVAVVSANDIWAVGFSNAGTLTEHWDGSSWTIIPSPSPDSSSGLISVAMVSANDVWAVGGTSSGTLIENWNGSNWTIISSTSSAYEGLTGVAVVSANDIWAVGSINGKRTLTEHWDGTAWAVIPSPSPRIGALGDELDAVAVVSTNNVWAVGTESTGDDFFGPLIENWNGTKWVVVNSARGRSQKVYNPLSAVASVPGTNHLWAVGLYYHDYYPQAFIEYYG